MMNAPTTVNSSNRCTHSNVRPLQQPGLQCQLGSNGYASPFITSTVSEYKSVQTYTILKINIDVLSTSQAISAWVPAQLRDLLCSVFSLRNNWDGYNQSQEQILNQQRPKQIPRRWREQDDQHTFHIAPWSSSFSSPELSDCKAGSSFWKQLYTTQTPTNKETKAAPTDRLKISEFRNCQLGYSVCCLYL